MIVTVENHQKKISLNPARIRRITKTILHHEGIDNAVLSVVFVTSQKIRALNKKYLKRNHATDVLAFNLKENGCALRHKRADQIKDITGDIIISTDVAIKNAKAYKTPLGHEIVLYVIHGILHLLGYDDHNRKVKHKMQKKEQEILEYLGTKIKTVVSGKS